MHSPGNLSCRLLNLCIFPYSFQSDCGSLYCTNTGWSCYSQVAPPLDGTYCAPRHVRLVNCFLIGSIYFPYHNQNNTNNNNNNNNNSSSSSNNNNKSYNFTTIPTHKSCYLNVSQANFMAHQYNMLWCSLTVLFDNMILHEDAIKPSRDIYQCSTRDSIDLNNINFFFTVVHWWGVRWWRVPDNKWRME